MSYKIPFDIFNIYLCILNDIKIYETKTGELLWSNKKDRFIM